MPGLWRQKVEKNDKRLREMDMIEELFHGNLELYQMTMLYRRPGEYTILQGHLEST